MYGIKTIVSLFSLVDTAQELRSLHVARGVGLKVENFAYPFHIETRTLAPNERV